MVQISHFVFLGMLTYWFTALLIFFFSKNWTNPDHPPLHCVYACPIDRGVYVSELIQDGRISTSESVLMNDLDFVYKCSVMRYACT